MAEEELNDTSTIEQDTAADDQAQDTTSDEGKAETEGGESLLTDKGEDKPVAAPADFPEDWRQKLAGDDEKAMKRLERFKSPQDVFKAYRALEAKMSSGEVKSTLPDDASEEEVAAYRKENGIPEKPEGYLESLPSGVVVGDDDKEMVNSFLEKVHAKNASPEFVSEALDWYYSTQEETIAQQAEADKQRRQEAEEELRSEWGAEYRSNINSIKSFLESAPATEDGTPLSDLLLGARLSDGVPLGDHPAALRWLSKMADEANPAGFVAPGVGGSQADTVESEITEIEKTMRTNRAAYNKDSKMQERYLQLLDAREKLKKRA